MNSQQLFRHSRLRLAAWYALVMGGILSLLRLGMAHVVPTRAFKQKVTVSSSTIALYGVQIALWGLCKENPRFFNGFQYLDLKAM